MIHRYINIDYLLVDVSNIVGLSDLSHSHCTALLWTSSVVQQNCSVKLILQVKI